MDINGTYTSDDKAFVLTITNSNEAQGTFDGTCVSTKDAPPSAQKLSLIGHWSYVGSGLTPLSICLLAFFRPADRSYCVQDAWTGVMTSASTLQISGVRCYLPASGPPQRFDLGTRSFSR